VRELKNAIERSIYRSTDADQQVKRIAFDPFDSPFRLREQKKQDAAKAAPVTARKSAARLPVDLKSHLAETEKQLLNAALEQARFNQRVAAELLGLTYHQLRGKLRKHRLDFSEPA
jgi:psp operon transcriptional activator